MWVGGVSTEKWRGNKDIFRLRNLIFVFSQIYYGVDPYILAGITLFNAANVELC